MKIDIKIDGRNMPNDILLISFHIDDIILRFAIDPKSLSIFTKLLFRSCPNYIGGTVVVLDDNYTTYDDLILSMAKNYINERRSQYRNASHS